MLNVITLDSRLCGNDRVMKGVYERYCVFIKSMVLLPRNLYWVAVCLHCENWCDTINILLNKLEKDGDAVKE